MKRKITVLAAFLLCAVMLLAFAACNPKPTLTGIEYVSGIKNYYYKDDVIAPEKIVIRLVYSNNTTADVNISAENVTGLDTSEFGTHTAVITYGGFEVEVSYTVREVDYKIYAIEEPAFVTAYKNNIREQENKQTEFVNRERGYKVGNENPFVFMPKALALNKNGEFVNIDSFPISYTLSVKKGDEFVELSGDELAATVTADTNKGYFSFSEDAVGNEYLLSVRPYILEEGQLEEEVTKSFEFTVVRGYNVYSAADLSVIDNSGRAEWSEFKQNKGITEENVSSVILHGDVSITADDFPSKYLLDETEVKTGDSDYKLALGSLKDWTNVYYRNIDENDRFGVIGNYFSLDASKVPLVVRTNNRVVPVGPDGKITEVIISHSTLIYFYNRDAAPEKASSEPQIVFENLFSIGNSNRSEDAMLSGGLIFNKITAIESAFDNTISSGWFITYFPKSMTETKLTIKDSKAYDAFNCLLYSWGGITEIVNSELIGAGGPVIIADHHSENTTTGEGGFISGVTVDENSVLESYVAGSEGWFQQFKATSVAATIKAISSNVFSQYGYTFTKTDNTIEKFNLIAVYKSGTSEGLSFSPIRGYMSIGKNHSMNFEDPTTMTILNGLKGSGAPIFQSNGAFCFFNGSALVNPLDMQPVTPDFALFKGEYLNLFVSSEGSSGYLGTVFGGLRAVKE